MRRCVVVLLIPLLIVARKFIIIIIRLFSSAQLNFTQFRLVKFASVKLSFILLSNCYLIANQPASQPSSMFDACIIWLVLLHNKRNCGSAYLSLNFMNIWLTDMCLNYDNYIFFAAIPPLQFHFI